MRALICGAGIAGLTLARRLDQMHWEVELVERAVELRDEGYLIDFFGPGFDAAAAMGLLPRLRQQAYFVAAVDYVNRNGRPRARLDYKRLASSLDGRLLTLLRGDLAQTLHEGLSDRVRQRFGCTVTSITETVGGVQARLSDGGGWDGDLLVGADGIHSAVRHLVFGPESDYLRYLGYQTAAYTFSDPGLHRQLSGRFCMTDSTNRTVGLYGLRNGRIAVFTAHRASDPAVPDDPRAEVVGRYADLGWLVPRALDHCPEPPALYYDQVAQIEMATWITGRVALIGDACQAVSLLAGQGASLAVAGGHILAEELGDQVSINDALARYHARLAPEVRVKQTAGRRAAEWFLPSTTLHLLMRRMALRVIRLPLLGHRLSTRLAAGGAGIP